MTQSDNGKPNDDIPIGEESCMAFPCQFPIKAMGKDARLVERTLVDAVQKHAPDSPRDQISRRESRTGKYNAVTITITADNREQLDRIYQDLSDSEHITMAL